MAKPILYWVLAKGSYAWTSTYGFRVIGVTSKQHGLVYGREAKEAGAITHVSARDIVYQFPEGTTAEFAAAAATRAGKEHQKHAEGIRQAQARVVTLSRNRDLAVLDAAKGLPVEPERAPSLASQAFAEVGNFAAGRGEPMRARPVNVPGPLGAGYCGRPGECACLNPRNNEVITQCTEFTPTGGR